MTLLRKYDMTSAVGRFDQVMTLANYANTVYSFSKNIKTFVSNKLGYNIYLSLQDPICMTVMREIIKRAPTENHKSIELGSIWQQGTGYTRGLDVVMSIESLVAIDIDGHTVQVSMVDSNGAQTSRGTKTQASGSVSFYADMRLCFRVHTFRGHVAVTNFLRECSDQHHDQTRNPSFLILDSWGDWKARKQIGSRSLDNIILKEGQLDRICSDLKNFLDSEDKYLRRNIPYHRGYLLHGPPGTGKTSLAAVLANYFKLNVYFMSLNDLDKDNTLLGIVADIPSNSVLIIEDIDIASSVSHSRDDDEEKAALIKHQQASLFGLLNALDGFITPHGLITIMTTNYAEQLDKALIRPGRIDMVEELSYADDYQASHLFKNFYFQDDLRPLPSVEGLSISPADILECFKQNLNDKDAGFFAFKKMVQAKTETTVPAKNEQLFDALPKPAAVASCC